MVRVERALVIAAGEPDGDVAPLPAADMVVAADSGADVARTQGRRIDVLVGDMDSVSTAARVEAEQLGARVVRHPAAKDETDLELALAVAVEAADSVHVVAAAGGRLDHAVANITVLASPRWRSSTIDATIGGHRLWVVRDEREIDGDVGDLVSLLAIGGPARGITTTGLRFELIAGTLAPTEARGVSNEITAPPARISLTEGVLVVIRALGR